MQADLGNQKPDAAGRPAAPIPHVDPAATLLFVINDAAGSSGAEAKRAVIETALAEHGRKGELLVCESGDLARVAAQAASAAAQRGSAVVAVGGDGSLNAVAQAAYAGGCAMGVIPYGTFNYFARTHGIPTDPAAASHLLLTAQPVPVQASAINERVFLVNASLGIYPQLLQDREAYKARFGRSRWVAKLAALATMLRAQRTLQLSIQVDGTPRDLRALTLFMGNSRLQLEQFGADPEDTLDGTPGDGTLAALVLKPVGPFAMAALALRGALGRLGDAPGVDGFEFHEMRVTPKLRRGRTSIGVAFDGEVASMSTPLHIRVLEQPLYLLKAAGSDGDTRGDP